MTSLETTGAAIRWFERSVIRRYDHEAEMWEPTSEDEEGIRLGIAIAVRERLAVDLEDDDDPHPCITVREEVQFDDQRATVRLSCAVRFNFNDDVILTADQTAEFVRDIGAEYVTGYLRGALSDLTRSVALPTVLMPATLPPEMHEIIRERAIEAFDE